MRLLGAISVFVALMASASASVADSHHDAQIPLGLSEGTQSMYKIPPSETDPNTLRNLEIDFSDPEPAAQSNAILQYLASPESPKDLVHEITVTGYQSCGNWTLLAEVLGQLTSLQDIHWNAHKAISKDILTHLETKNPVPRLHYRLSFSNWDPWDERVPVAQPIGEEHDHDTRATARCAIIGSKALHSLVAEIEYGGSPNRQDMDLVFRILSNSPNLKGLDLSIDHSGCVVSDGQPTSFDFASNPDARFPALEVLSLAGFDLDATSHGNGDWDFIPYTSWQEKRVRREYWPLKWLPTFIMDGVDEIWNSFDYAKRDLQVYQQERERSSKSDGKTNLDHWLMIMDWSHLHTLDLKWARQGTLTRLRAETLPSLKNITLTGPYCSQTALNFIANTTVALESISLRHMQLSSFEDAVDVIATHHNQSLKHLTIHDTETYQTRSTATATIKAEHLSKLLASCTRLQKLEFDLPRPPLKANGSHVIEDQTATANLTQHQLPIYDLLATAPELQNLILHYPSPDLITVEEGTNRWHPDDIRWCARRAADGDDIPDLFINRNSTLELFTYLRGGKKALGEGLAGLEILVGDWENRHLPREMMARPQKRIARYVCRVGVEGREVCEGYQTRNDD